jgi:adenosylcobinamide-phosphate guanylyltransferase
MDALVMCGGKGTRLGLRQELESNATEKPLLDVCGRPMLDLVASALAAARIDTTYAVVSPHTPETTAHAEKALDLPIIETPGTGYVADLDCALSHVERPVLTVAADLPLLDGVTVDAVLDGDFASDGSLTVCVPVERKRELGVSVDTTFVDSETDVTDKTDENGENDEDENGKTLAPSGLNIVANSTDTIMIRDSYRLAVNVNRPRDAQIAEALCD